MSDEFEEEDLEEIETDNGFVIDQTSVVTDTEPELI